MNEFPQIGRRLPYKESDEYVNQLIARCTQNAIKHEKKPRISFSQRSWMWMGIAASIIAVAGTFFALNRSSDYDLINNSRSLDEVLASLDDDDMESIDFLTAINTTTEEDY